MPDLLHSLQNQDLGHLRIIAQLWGLELSVSEVANARAQIAASLLDRGLALQQTQDLPVRARQALAALMAARGRIAWPAFARQFGEVREMGAARRDRQRPYLKPESAAEMLFYRGFLARAFFDTDDGPREFAYVPDDLLQVLAADDRHAIGEMTPPAGRELQAGEVFGRPATLVERAIVTLASDRILDDATTLLSARRAGVVVHPDTGLVLLLRSAGLLKRDAPQAAAVKRFLEMPRDVAMELLFEAWRTSDMLSELRMLPGLTFEGEWLEPRLRTRAWLLEIIQRAPLGEWWSLPAFIQDIKVRHPEFQRPAGDYDSWFIRRNADGAYLRGFESWDEVDGALVRLFITNFLHRLGTIDLASPATGGEATAFRRALPTARALRLEQGKLQFLSNGRISAQRQVPRAVRYQLARFCEWDSGGRDEYQYRITPKSLSAARAQGLAVHHLLALLSKHSAAGVPPALHSALKRWDTKGTEAQAEAHIVLRVRTPEVLSKLRQSKAARFLGETLGPTAVIIKAGAQAKVMAALAEMGVLGDDGTQTPVADSATEQARRKRAGT
jgi:hypothetical protein